MQKVKRLKRMLAMMLATTMLLGTVATAAGTEPKIEKTAQDSGISDLINAGGVNPLTGKETAPFNAAADASILMTKENELMLFSSNKTGSGADEFFHIFEKMDAETPYLQADGTVPGLNLSFVTAVALDASGNATDDHVAYLGVNGAKKLCLVLYDARHLETVTSMEIGDVSAWVGDVDHWAYKTFFSITAGDYDNDGIDEIACTDANMGVQMIEVNGGALVKGPRYGWSELVPQSVAEQMSVATNKIYRRALISLATGNLDGTGAEELAVAVSTNHPGSSNLPTAPLAYTTQVAAVVAPLSGSAAIRTTSVHSTDKGTDEEEQDDVYYHILYAGQIAVGDVNGDRMDEIVVAGYPGTLWLDGNGTYEDGRYELDGEDDAGKIALCYAALDGTALGHSEITKDAMTPFIEEGFYHYHGSTSNDLLAPLSVDAAKLHGQYGKESVFVGGKVYQFTDGKASPIHTHAFFENEMSAAYSDAYVEHVTSGVFGGADPITHKEMINEQFVFTVVAKDNGNDEYNYKVGFISMSVNQETDVQNFNDNTTRMNEDGYLLEERDGGVEANYGTALVPVAVDVDNDGLLVKHVATGYFYEDPSVEAVLQAAPYFAELGDWNNFNGSTTYSVTVSRSLVDVWGYTHSIHTSLKGKVGNDTAGELEVKVGYALDIYREHEKSYTSSYTTTFEAGSYDTVVVQRTPYVWYEYAYVDLNGNLLEGEDAGSVVFMEAMPPAYFQLSVEEYNQFVDEYNAMAERHDSEGNVHQVPVVGYVVTNVKSPMTAPAGVEAYLSGRGNQVTVEWSASSGGDALQGYHIYRSCDNQDPVLVNSTLLSPDATSFVDTTKLRPGKIYTYYVAARYTSDGGYKTMNSKSSMVVWGIPLFWLNEEENGGGAGDSGG